MLNIGDRTFLKNTLHGVGRHLRSTARPVRVLVCFVAHNQPADRTAGAVPLGRREHFNLQMITIPDTMQDSLPQRSRILDAQIVKLVLLLSFVRREHW